MIRQAFDPDSETFGESLNQNLEDIARADQQSLGHGNERNVKSILHYLTAIPRVPQVQLIGNGIVHDHEGFAEVKLKHPSHETSHKTRVSQGDVDKGVTRFNRWHIDAALYDLSPPKVTTLYAVHVPIGPKQVCRYDDGTGDELEVPLGTTAFISGKTMFDLLPKELKSLAVRSKAKYAPHPYIWMSPARLMPNGLGIESEGIETALDQLPAWEESLIQILPLVSSVPSLSITVTFNFHSVFSAGSIQSRTALT
jgi:xanthine dioxygenase